MSRSSLRTSSAVQWLSSIKAPSINVHFITGLLEHKVHFVVALFGRDVDGFTLHISENTVIAEPAPPSYQPLTRR